jgi:signal transduction histidine kinase
VRFRITLVATLVVGIVLVLASVGLVTAQRRSLTASLEESLAQEADALVGDARSNDLATPLDVAGDDDTVAQVVEIGAGDPVPVLAATPNLTARAALVDTSAEGSVTSTVDSVLEANDHFLFVTHAFAGSTDALVAVSVGAPLDDVEAATAALTRSLLLGVPLVVVLLAALVWWLAGRTLRPVEAIRSGVGEISGSDLHRRVPVPSGDDEVARLARTMNAMLDRVESSAQRQQRFVADASHELRSPLTRIRSELEVDLAHPSGADPSATHRSVLDEVDGLQRLVDDLLLLARSDDAGFGAAAVLDLDDLVLDEAHRVTGAADERGVVVDSSAISPARVVGDARAIGRAVRNVVENAVRHAESRVVVSVRVDGGRAEVRVIDDGPGIPANRVDELFERFTRLDDARSGSDGGTGLGLAIARDVVERHGGTIGVDAYARSGASFVITLPLATG